MSAVAQGGPSSYELRVGAALHGVRAYVLSFPQGRAQVIDIEVSAASLIMIKRSVPRCRPPALGSERPTQFGARPTLLFVPVLGGRLLSLLR